ncbi:uncharacterized protein TRAVEDRAFT_30463 [Trametes versicolor FP-101664 SS1]|uniref:uncharacterized protein n=1 Tax=Trametes versicolor (strain FP-101664) TaxID=717944 RepID=UPI0004623E78|nr:uncharacterized protein TRAVEDRAFT_30463 [Trametes versicolor FP-101664 SS1]EIW55722.1 hypothetical protein TRAVEDRAFT_30463 [Trametes versicolor FP-101664 SS1]
MVTAGVPYPTRSARIRVVAPDDPIVGHQPLEWRPGHEDHTGQVEVYDPQIGIHWLPEPQCRHLAVRARGTQSDARYAIAKEPSQLDDGDVSPGPNPLQLTGVPEGVLAGSSGSAIQRVDEDALFSTAREGSAFFQNQQIASVRAVTFAADEPGPSTAGDTSLSALHGFAGGSSQGGALFSLGAPQEPGQSGTARPLVRTQVPAETLPQPSPASSWGGTYQPSRRSSLSLHVNNLPPPSDSQDTTSDSVEEGSIEFFGQSMTVDIADNASGSFRSGEARPSGLLLNTSREGSSRQVVTGLHDLEAINRSLSEIAEPAQSDTRSTRSSPSAPASSRQPRQAPASGHDSREHVGLRTGIALYSSRPTTQYPAAGPSTEPLSAPPAPSTHVRSLSRTSTRSRAESTVSHSTSGSGGSGGSGGASSQRPSGQRHRRSSTASSVHFHDQLDVPPAFRPAEPQDTHAYTSQGPYADAPRGSQDSIPRSLGSIGEFGTGGGLLLSFEAPSTSSAVDRHGDAAAGIHAPRPVASSRSSTRSLFSGAWNARNGR